MSSALGLLKGLSLDVFGKARLWRTLQRIQPRSPKLAAIDFHSLEARAQAQLEVLEGLRILAADALGPIPTEGVTVPPECATQKGV